MPSGYDPMGENRFSLATNTERVCAEIMLNNKIERDDDSKKSHPALVAFPTAYRIACGRNRDVLPVIGFSSSRTDSPHGV